jgi:tRNA A37 N6-isopentenylltransferase MiaA
MTLSIFPISLQHANAFIEAHHRHHKPLRFHKYSIGASKNEQVVGVCVVNRPVNPAMDDGLTLEVARLCTDGTKNACSFLLSRAAQAAKALGYHRIQTYTTEEETLKSRGTSLWASGWLYSHVSKGGTWNHPCRPRTDKHPTGDKFCWVKFLVEPVKQSR